MRSIIELLRWLGVRVVLDEFGGGQASLSCLREFDFDGIRIARAFTGAMGSDPRGGNFVRAISEMARVLGVEVAAQGVATDDQLRLLRDAKIDFVQGDLLGGVVAANTVSAALHLDRQM
jgi:EAL domain-containing protein (putative c-di-GMP-specific phosphodiesterase class I)